MTTKFQTYPKHKDSGVEWVDRISMEWQMIRNLGIFSERVERARGEEKLLSISISRGVTTQEDLDTKKDGSNDDKSNYKIVEPNDVAYNKMRMWQGAVGVSRYHGIVSPAYIILKPKSFVESRYFYYQYKTQVYNELSYQYGHGIVDDQHSLRYWQFKTLYSILPPLKTQQCIADFLDEKTKIIDELVAKKEQMIDLLREKRTALITRAVTKGLDSHAELKPSGVDWLGDIPEGWDVGKLKHYVLWTRAGDVIDQSRWASDGLEITYSCAESPFFSDYSEFRMSRRTKEGDLLLARNGYGVVHIPKPNSIYTNVVQLVRLSPKCYPVFVRYQLTAGLPVIHGKSMGDFITSINYGMWRDADVCLPKEFRMQQRIANFLDSETEKMAKAVALIESQIEKLKEYRSSLIYSAVTGKIKI
ncbi:MAG: restriction endonuclease subunit S [bacterium]|nr:restriction endonuclease subunit S [bacterium]